MKKKLLAVILSVVMLLGMSVTPVSALEISENFTSFAEKYLPPVIELFVEKAVGGLTSIMRENKYFLSEDEYTYDNFYKGTETFITEAAEGASWSLGQADASLVPENWQDYELYLGGYISTDNGLSNDVREILDDMKVRVIALNDGSGRGTAVFATIDAIGITNTDIRQIRQMLSGLAEEYNINSINVYSTHAHSAIDTQGLWTNILGKWPGNIIGAIAGLDVLQQGTDKEYMDFLFGKVTQAVTEAVTNMNEGTMTYAVKDVGSKYFSNKNRPTASALDTEIRRFTFTPDDEAIRPTMIVNMSAHPDSAGLPTGSGVNGHGLSGDYVYYLGEVINGAGYDFMFFNGAICGIYSERINVNRDERIELAADYGKEIGQIVLSMTKSYDEVVADEYIMGLNFTSEKTDGTGYKPWYTGWTAVEETELDPILNIRLATVEIHVTNPIIKLAAKSGLVNYSVKVKGRDYYVTTEIGYMEWGKDVRIAMVPGEFCSDLAFGGSSLTAEGSYSKTAFSGRTLAEIFGEDIIVFGLANDAVGYIVPDNDYSMSLIGGHYQESISLGKETASTIMAAFEQLK